MNILSQNDSIVLIIDLQEKLVKMLEKDIIVEKVSKIVKAANILKIPVIATEQYPAGLGKTVLPVSENFNDDTAVFEKVSFSALDTDGLRKKLKSYGKKQVVLCGIETHICVHQTCSALLDEGYEVYVIKDACASRNKYEFKQGIDLMKQNGAKISCLEIALFEWLKTARHPDFKEIQALIK